MSISRAAEARLLERLLTWSNALKHARKEHGTPNSFGVVELAGEYGLTKAHGYYLGFCRTPDLTSWCGFPVEYAKGRFYVDQRAPRKS